MWHEDDYFKKIFADVFALGTTNPWTYLVADNIFISHVSD